MFQEINFKFLSTTTLINLFLKGATSRFVHLEKFSLNFSSLSFAIHVNLRSFLFILVSLDFVYPGKLLFKGLLPINEVFNDPKTTQNS